MTSQDINFTYPDLSQENDDFESQSLLEQKIPIQNNELESLHNHHGICPACDKEVQKQTIRSITTDFHIVNDVKTIFKTFSLVIVCTLLFAFVSYIILTYYEAKTKIDHQIDAQFQALRIEISKGNQIGHSKYREYLRFTMSYNVTCGTCKNVELRIFAESPGSFWDRGVLWKGMVLKTQQNILTEIKWENELNSMSDDTSIRGKWVNVIIRLCSDEFWTSCPYQYEGFQIPRKYKH